MNKLIIITCLIILIYYCMKRNENIYSTAYRIGTIYLDNMPIYPNYSVMFDIDDTLIFSKNHKPIPQIIKLMKYCNDNNILTLIITARDSIYKKETIQELMDNNIYAKHDNFYESPKNAVFYDFLYLRKSPEDNDNLFKSRIKEQLAKNHGIITIMSVGDNQIDINGKYSGYSIKLPNVHDSRLFYGK